MVSPRGTWGIGSVEGGHWTSFELRGLERSELKSKLERFERGPNRKVRTGGALARVKRYRFVDAQLKIQLGDRYDGDDDCVRVSLSHPLNDPALK